MQNRSLLLCCFLLINCTSTPSISHKDLVQSCIDKAQKTKGNKLTKDEQDACHSKVIPLVEASTLDGGLSQGEVIATLKPALKQLRWCYDAELERTPTLNGNIYFKWFIDAHGRVVGLKVDAKKGTLKHKSLETCSSKVLAGLRFTKPRNGKKTLAEYPIAFKPR